MATNKATSKAKEKKAGTKKAAGKKAAKPKPGARKPKAEKPEKAKKPEKTKKAPKKKPQKKKADAQFAAADVNLGHIFALRPRVATSFRPEDLRTAKHQLEDEKFGSSAKAARAVAEKALEILHDGPSRSKKGSHGSKRW